MPLCNILLYSIAGAAAGGSGDGGGSGGGGGGGGSNAKEKNRQAQRRFRERQKSTITDLKDKVKALERQVGRGWTWVVTWVCVSRHTNGSLTHLEDKTV